MHIIVAYDITDDRRRARMRDWLMGYLWPVQKSVFEGDLPEPAMRQLLAGARRIRESSDAVRVYTVCTACARRTEDMGSRTPQPWVERVYVA